MEGCRPTTHINTPNAAHSTAQSTVFLFPPLSSHLALGDGARDGGAGGVNKGHETEEAELLHADLRLQRAALRLGGLVVIDNAQRPARHLQRVDGLFGVARLAHREVVERALDVRKGSCRRRRRRQKSV